MAAHNPRSHEADRHAHERELLAEPLLSTGIGLQLDCAPLCMLHPTVDTLPKDSVLPATASTAKRTARAARHDAGLRLRTQDASTHTRQLTEPTTTPRTRPHRRSSLTRTQSGPIPLAFESAGLDAEHRTSIKFRPHSALQYFVESFRMNQ